MPALAIFPVLVRVLVGHMGFLGSAAAIAIVQWLMVLFLLAYLRMRPVYKAETWPGLSLALIRESVMRLDRMKEFAGLSLGGVLGLSEWWFCEVMCVIAGSFGTVAFVAHSIAYSMWILAFMIPLGTLGCGRSDIPVGTCFSFHCILNTHLLKVFLLELS